MAKEVRTIALRLDPALHPQLTMLAKLADVSVADLIRSAIDEKLASLQQDPAIHARAAELQAVLARDAQAQADVLASLLQPAADTAKTRQRRATASEQA